MDIDSIEAGPHKSIPWIDPFKMMTCLAETDKLHLLHGDHDLMEFWRRFAKVQPNHRVFDLAAGGSLKLGSTIPIYSHGDEGRGKKKKGILIWSMRGCLGKGTEHFRAKHTETDRLHYMGLNMGGSMCSRFLHIAVPKSMYAKNAEFVWDDIAFQIACSYRRLELQGFRDCNGKHWHAVCLGLTGDNPFLAKVGHLERSFTRVAKASGEQADAGICWQCLAGTPNIPYENFVLNPEWSYTLFETLPWLQQPPFLRGLGLAADLARAPQELHFDVWHNFHGGLAKHMVASTIAEILPNMEEGNLQQKLDRIFQAYLSWKKQSKLTLHCGRLDAELLGMESGIQVCPEGKWSKFSDSRVLLAFLEFFLIQRRDYVPTQITEEALSGVVSANRCFHLLYEAGFWMPASAASEAGEHGMRFLHAYARLAWFTMSEGRSRFPMVPKSHYLHHSFRALVLAARSCKFVVNALATSVQLDEDFIGKVSRLSRRVGSYYLMRRTLQRYVVCAHLEISCSGKEKDCFECLFARFQHHSGHSFVLSQSIREIVISPTFQEDVFLARSFFSSLFERTLFYILLHLQVGLRVKTL